MKYRKGGYVRKSDKSFLPVGLIHRSECQPFTLNKSDKKTGEFDPRIDHGITKQIMDIIEASRNLNLLKENRIRLLNYNHLFSNQPFKDSCSMQLKEINKRIENIESALAEENKRSTFSVRVNWSHSK